MAEPLKVMNNNRYLVFYDNGDPANYVQHKDLRVVVQQSPQVWKDVLEKSTWRNIPREQW